MAASLKFKLKISAVIAMGKIQENRLWVLYLLTDEGNLKIDYWE